MTFKQLADRLGLSLCDLIPDTDTREELENEQLFSCMFTDELVSDGVLSKDLLHITEIK